MENTKHRKLATFALPPFLAASLFFTGCDVDQTAEGEMPEVDVEYEEGELPEYDVEMADVDMGTTTETVSVPKVKVVVEEEEVEVPYVDIEMPDENQERGKMRQTITAKVEAPGTGYDLKIVNAYYQDGEIAVLSRISKSSGSSVQSKEGVPLKDTIVINAPEAEINHYVIAPRGEFEGHDGDYTFESDRSEFDLALSNYSQIYSR